jgi:hypothetical protein
MRTMKKLTQKNTARPTRDESIAYGALATAFLASSSAQAQITFVDIDPDVVLQQSSYTLDLDNNGTNDFVFRQRNYYTGSGSGPIIQAQLRPVNQQGAQNGVISYDNGQFVYDFAAALSFGEVVDPSSPQQVSFEEAAQIGYASIYADWGLSSSGPYFYGEWVGQDAYLGVFFRAGGNMHYGWVAMEVAADGMTMKLKSYAYNETPNTGVVAGSLGTVGLRQTGRKGPLRLSPNPSIGQTAVHFDAPQNGACTVRLVGPSGAVVWQNKFNVTSGPNVLALELGELATGTYVVELQQEDVVVRQRLQKVR